MEFKTPLYDRHVAAGGKIVPFGGYLLPVQYQSGVIAEHIAVRTAAGLFDVSHMGEIIISGKDALSNLHRILTNDFSTMYDGRVRYTLMCYDNGGVVDDMVVCRMNEGKYMLVVNAANRKKDADWIRSHLSGEATMDDISDSVAQVALQGPKAPQILGKLAEKASIPQKYYTFEEKVEVGGISCLVSRTGYTGELGYELYCAPGDVGKLWDILLETGAEDGMIPCGLGARDTLRLEAGMPLYGHEMNENITPFEAGLSFGVKMDTHDFIGKKALEGKTSPEHIRIGLTVTGRGIARGGETVSIGGKEVGRTTSGTFCPFVKSAVAMALVDSANTKAGTEVELDIRSRTVSARITELPFYKRS